MNGKLTLLSAPAGYGKSTLLAEWIHQTKIPSAWLSVDVHDNDPERFWVYFLAALKNIHIPEIYQAADAVFLQQHIVAKQVGVDHALRQ